MTGSSCKYVYYEYDYFKNFFMLFERLAEITVNAAIENIGPMYVCVFVCHNRAPRLNRLRHRDDLGTKI